MSDKSPLNVVLLWHMHQPSYRDAHSSKYFLPWTYLHIIKDYADMAAHLEAEPAARAVVNFTPTLLEQIDDYAIQIKDYFDNGTEICDPLLDALIQPVLSRSMEVRLSLIKQCLRANEDRLIRRYPEYARLAELAKWLQQHHDAIIYLGDQYIIDILVWFHLAWLGETIRRSNATVKLLLEKGKNFTLHDRKALIQIIGEVATTIIPRYRRLAETGQIELSLTPYAHPIMPLLLDLHSAEDAMPDVKLPVVDHYPGGAQRAQWHIDKAKETFNHFFGFVPKGCWPSEGSVSTETLALLQKNDFIWAASGETVLRNSLNHANTEPTTCLHQAYTVDKQKLACFFRDDGLSDIIGFTYATWHADDAVANLVHHLENIAVACQEVEAPVVSIIMDGENAWEYYPENGYYFLHALYKALAHHPTIKLTTYSEYLKNQSARHALPRLIAGSWVYGTFSTWIGSTDKNRGWEMLVDAKRAYDRRIGDPNLSPASREKIEHQLAICEGSDWFWWFGDYNPADSVNDFDYLFRLQLANLYLFLGMEPPAYLSESFSHGSGNPMMGGVMRPGKAS